MKRDIEFSTNGVDRKCNGSEHGSLRDFTCDGGWGGNSFSCHSGKTWTSLVQNFWNHTAPASRLDYQMVLHAHEKPIKTKIMHIRCEKKRCSQDNLLSSQTSLDCNIKTNIKCPENTKFKNVGGFKTKI